MTENLQHFYYDFLNGKKVMVYHGTLQHRDVSVVMSLERYIDLLTEVGYYHSMDDMWMQYPKIELSKALKIIAEKLNKLTEDEIESCRMEAMIE